MGIKNDEGPKQYYKLAGPEDKTLIFESRFESGKASFAKGPESFVNTSY